MILAIDPGLVNFGIVVLNEEGIIHYTKVIQSNKTKDKKVSVASDYVSRICAIMDEIKKVSLRYPLTEIVAEMPPFAFQSANAAISLSIGAATIVATHVLLDLPVSYASPRRVKEYFTGDPNADKKAMMFKCCHIYDWEITYKTVKQKNKPARSDPIYWVRGEKLSAGYFEHIADAIAVFYTIKG